MPLVLWLLLGAPLCEELVFRGGIQTRLALHLGTPCAVVGSSLLFAASHALQLPTLLAAMTFLPSLILGSTFAATGRLRDAVALHALFNALWWLAMPVPPHVLP